LLQVDLVKLGHTACVAQFNFWNIHQFPRRLL